MAIPELIMKCRDVVSSRGNYLLIAGESGTGKTQLIRTAPNLQRTLVIDLENGLRTICDVDVDVAVCNTVTEFEEIIEYTKSSEFLGAYDLLYVDGLTALAEMVLAEQPVQADNKDYMTKYNVVKTKVLGWHEHFRRMPINVVATVGIVRNKNTGLFGFMVPGALSSKLNYLPDFVCATRVTETETNELLYGLQFCKQSPYEFTKARDPHNALEPFEEPNLAGIFSKLEASDNRTESAAQ